MLTCLRTEDRNCNSRVGAWKEDIHEGHHECHVEGGRRATVRATVSATWKEGDHECHHECNIEGG